MAPPVLVHQQGVAPMHPVVEVRDGSSLAGPYGDYVAVYSWFLGLQVLDLMSTLSVLGQGGLEANPGPALAVAQWGLPALLATKLVLIVLTLVVWVPASAWLAARPHSVRRWAVPTVTILVLAVALFYTAVVFYNLTNLALLIA